MNTVRYPTGFSRAGTVGGVAQCQRLARACAPTSSRTAAEPSSPSSG